MDDRIPPKGSVWTKEKDAPQDKGSNALWRIPEWFPDLEPKLAEEFKTYHSELLKFNARLNLISRSTERDADEVHFADAILASQIINKQKLGSLVYDIGSGNGLPGVMLAIMLPNTEFRLVEADARKCEFLKHIIHHLGLKNCRVMNIRMESLQAAEIECAVSRGFAPLPKALLIVNRAFVPGGEFYHLKGVNWGREIADIPSQLISGWSPELVAEYSLPISHVPRAVVKTTKK